MIIPATAQWTHEQINHHGGDKGYVWAQQHGLPLTKTGLAWATAECQICQQQTPKQSPHYGTILEGTQLASWWQIDYPEPLPSLKG